MNVFVQASTKSHIPRSHDCKSGCRLANFLCTYLCCLC